VQARAAGAVRGTLEDLRALVARTQALREYRPGADRARMVT
jgi:rhamnulokinase